MFELSRDPIDPAALRARLAAGDGGGFVCFEGRVRRSNAGREVLRLDYEAYPPLAEKLGREVVAEARERFGLAQVLCVHRVGSLAIGEVAVWIGVLAAHRGEAFAGCRYLIDELKGRVPIWKKEHYASGAAAWIPPPGARAVEENGKFPQG